MQEQFIFEVVPSLTESAGEQVQLEGTEGNRQGIDRESPISVLLDGAGNENQVESGQPSKLEVQDDIGSDADALGGIELDLDQEAFDSERRSQTDSIFAKSIPNIDVEIEQEEVDGCGQGSTGIENVEGVRVDNMCGPKSGKVVSDVNKDAGLSLREKLTHLRFRMRAENRKPRKVQSVIMGRYRKRGLLG